MFAIRPMWVKFFRRQQSYVAVAVAIYAALWAVGMRAAVGSLLIYTLALCNLTVALEDRLDSAYGQCSPARRWMIFTACLLVLTPIGVTIVNLIQYHLLKGPGQSLWQFIKHGWKMPSVAALIFGISSQLYRTMRSRLELRNRELQREVEMSAAQRQLQIQELEQAREIQQNLLPKQIPQIAGFEIVGAWEPARVVGGDYFDVIKLSETKLGICIADVVGKGVSAALLMANVQASVRAFASETVSPAALCARVNSVLCASIASDKFVTLFYGVLDAGRKLLRYTNAGHLPPILTGLHGQARQLAEGDALLGVFPGWKYHDRVVSLADGDRLVLFTDGITEAFDSRGEEFGEHRLTGLLRANAGKSAGELKNVLLTAAKDFCASRFADDATLIVVAACDLPATGGTPQNQAQAAELAHSA